MNKLFLKTIQFLTLSLLLVVQMKVYAGSDFVVEKTYYEDTTASETFADVKTKTFTPYKDILNKGYSSSVFWIRIQLDQATLHDQENIAIKITPAYLDGVDIFNGRSSIPIQTIGDRYPVKNNSIAALNFNFITSFDQAHPYLWLRLQTTSTNLINVEVIKPEALNESIFWEYLFGGLLIGIFCVFSVLVVIYFFVRKELINGVFFLSEIAALMLILSLMGYIRLMFSRFLSFETMDNLTGYSIIFYTLITLIFYKLFFDEYKTKKWVNIYFAIALAFTCMAVFIFNFGMAREALSLNMKIVAVSGVAFFLIPLLGLDWKNTSNPLLSKRILLLTQIHSLIGVLYIALPSLGVIGGNRFSAYTGLIHPAITSFIMILMASYRMIKHNKERAMEIAEKTRKMEHEKAQKEIQAQFMSMLTHELRTPLSVLRLALPNKSTVELTGRAKLLADQAIDDMLVLIEHCTQLDKLDQGLQPISIQRVRVDAFLANVRERLASKVNLNVVGNTQLVVLCDATLLQVIFNNLLDNAMKYGMPAGGISIHVEAVNAHAVRIGVQNQIPPQLHLDGEDLFRKFYRNASAQQVSGTGLGLYIVRAMCELMQGRAYANVSVANFITVWLELPAA